MRVMKIAVVLLLLGGIMPPLAKSCPNGYRCQWDRDVFVLRCHAADGKLPLKTGIITGVPGNATRLKAYCYNRNIPMPLAFVNLSNIRELTLDNLKISLMGRQMFRGVASLTDLILRGVHLERFDADSFHGLIKLRSLTVEHLIDLDYMDPDMLTPLISLEALSFRHLRSRSGELSFANYAQVLAGIESSHFQTLVLFDVHSRYNPETALNIDDLFGNSSIGLTLKRLDLSRNNIEYISGSPLTTLPILEHIHLDENAIIGSRGSRTFTKFWMQLLAHRRLKTLSINGMNHLAGPTIDDVFFSLNANKDCSQSIKFNFGNQLEAISLRNTAFLSNSMIANFQFCFIDKLGSLKYADITNIRCTKSTRGSIGHVHALEYFILQDANVHKIEMDMFHEMPNLRVLLMGGNDIGVDIASDTEARLFKNNYNLRVLDLAGCRLTEIPRRLFANLHKLQQLNLSGNALRSFNVDLHALGELQMLNLSRNKLTTLPLTVRTHLDNVAAVQPVIVDISENPLQCLCANTAFVTWSHTTRVTFLNQDNTFCIKANNSMVLLFSVDSESLETTCPTRDLNYGNVLAWTLLSIAAAVVVMSIVLFMAYRHRRNQTATPTPTPGDVVYERDAFICYNSNDSAWVCNDLLKHLENRQVSTVIHQRDFLPGSILEDIIRESIAKCRYTVLVLSPDFLASNWCLLEMHLARAHVSSHVGGGIVAIILREFPLSQLTRTLEDILSKSYLKWTDSPQGQLLFWDKLVTKLRRGGNLRPLRTQ